MLKAAIDPGREEFPAYRNPLGGGIRFDEEPHPQIETSTTQLRHTNTALFTQVSTFSPRAYAMRTSSTADPRSTTSIPGV
jgi:hypothetical protein